MIADFKADIGQAAAKELSCDFHETDVTKRSDWEALYKHTVDNHGKVDIIINNAGSTYRNKVRQFFYIILQLHF